jgi:hypothetical protein
METWSESAARVMGMVRSGRSRLARDELEGTSMGLDASVMCNCYRDGKTTEPPVPREWLEVDGEGHLDLKAGCGPDGRWADLYGWKESCCEHEGMNCASEHISNWSGYRLFQAVLEEVGWEHFPVLRRELPEVNGGLTDSRSSRLALAELDSFMEVGELGPATVLVDSSTGEALYEYVAAYDGVFIRSGDDGVEVGLGEFELFVRDSATGADLFRASRVRLFTPDGAPITAGADRVVWEDPDTGRRYDSSFPITGGPIPWDDGRWTDDRGVCRFEYPAELHVDRHPRTVHDFDDIVRALRVVFTASVETGNPVRWC